MARQARLTIPGYPHHLLIRGNNRQPIFADDHDRQTLLAHLGNILREHPLALHAYVLMPDHVHLLVTPGAPESVGRAMQSLGRRYVGGFNARHQRSGTLWEGRYRAHVVGGPTDVLRCMRFIELNPQRAGLASDLFEPAWSSLRHHLGALRDPLITEPSAYWTLGNTPFEREAAYRAWVEQGVSANDKERMAAALRSGRPLGDAAFVAELERQTARSLSPRPRGRPRKMAETSS
ncbi:transposase [Ideonella sp.]|uniref:transposase n=1 Tax=Ideonella sp. TaxID=1929293 RepID=UPI002B479CB2|nr:transposase [Ideonella sp.]HJV68333.1 transposase [Ideonella sp.]